MAKIAATPAPTVLAGLAQALRAHPPFRAMAEADLTRIVRAARIRYFSPGEVIIPPAAERPVECLMIRQGAVRGERPGPDGVLRALFELAIGEMLPLGALLARRGVTSTYRAVGDTFCIAFPVATFDALLADSAVFQDFCTRRLAYLLDHARAALQAEFAAEVTSARGSGAPLASLPRGAAVTVTPETSLTSALKLLEQRRIGSLPIVDAQGIPLGIFTNQDVIGRVALPQRPLATPIGEVMSSPAITLPGDATAGDAALLMAQRGIRHVIVVDRAGVVTGVVSERDLFGLQRLSVREIASTLRRAVDVDALAACAADIRALASALVAQGVPSGQLTRLIAGLNDQLTVRVLDLLAPQHDLAGLTPTWLGMGSEGRSEQTIATDQDNGLVFVADDAAAAAAIRARLLPFARAANEALDRCGYPLCKGGVMAMNPQWCLSLDEWRAAFFQWIDRGDPVSLLAANIFFDFRPLWGATGPATVLRDAIAVRARANSRFLKQMSDNALNNRPPLSWLGALAADDDPDGIPGIDLKRAASMPFTDAARILALAGGVTATNTVERLERAGEALGIGQRETRAWIDAYEYVLLLRLRTQHRRAAGILPPSDNPNRVPLDDLSGLDQRILHVALRELGRLQQRLEADYPG